MGRTFLAPGVAVSSLVLGIGACSLGCSRSGGSSTASSPSVVLVTLDTLRADHVGAYGYPRNTTPTLDALADEALLFEHCLAPVAHTAPSHLSLLTGVYPYEHGMLSNAHTAKDDARAGASAGTPGQVFRSTAELRSFAELAATSGYATAAFVSAAPLKRVTGLDAGFGTWSEPDGARRLGVETTRAALAWLGAHPEGDPYCLWAHYFDAHGPYAAGNQPPEPYDTMFEGDDAIAGYLEERAFSPTVEGPNTPVTRTRRIVDLYDGSVRWLDDGVAPLFEGLAERADWSTTLLVVVGDHGQGLGQHDYLAHGSVWREQLHVPLWIRAPGVAARRVATPLSVIDVLPAALGLAAPSALVEAFSTQSRGVDVLAASSDERAVFAMSPPRRGLEALSLGEWKYVRRVDGAEELYDLAADPHELRNVADEEPERRRDLERRLTALTQEMRARGARILADRAATAVASESEDGAGETGIDDALLRELEALGYGGGDE